tara:strand:- start:22772 stop:24790 length:2019 start_codon:yes stop_codon:yes gene_type:complete
MANTQSNKSNKKNHQESKKNKSSSDKNSQYKFQWKQAGKTSLIWILILGSAIFLSNVFSGNDKTEPVVEYFQYRVFLESNLIKEATVIAEKEFHGVLGSLTDISVKERTYSQVDRFSVILPYVNETTLEEWDQYGIQYSFIEKKIDWAGYLLSMAPWLLLIVFWIFIMRRMQGGAGTKGLFNFGKSRARLWTSDKPDVTFKHVAGCEEAKTELGEIINFLKDSKRYQKLGGKVPKGVLLLGPPGTGKTLLARAIAGEAGVPFFSISGADFVEMFVGVGASRVRDLFEQGKKHSPSIIFIDEIDAVGRHRGAGLGGGHDEREQTLNAMLVEMDGFEPNTNVIILAATNRPDVLDNALLRPGRFDRQIIVDVPDLGGRKGILEVHTKDVPIAKDVDLEILSRGTPGLVGADLANLVNEASLLAARRKKKKVEMVDFEDAKDRVMMGVERTSMIISDEEKKLTAYHEGGHALVAKKMPKADPIHKVTIIPRGRALGLTAQLPIDEKHNYAEEYIKSRLAVLMGGRAAEQLIFNELTTGSGNDIEHATDIARKMVCEWGMSHLMGPLTYGKKDEELFLGREIQTHKDYSDNTADQIDKEIFDILTEAENTATDIIKKNIEFLHRIAEELLEHETIDGQDIDNILDGKKITRKSTRPSNGRKKRAQRKKKKPEEAAT